MRQVFASARLENVEEVARFLEDAGIETRITNGRSYKGGIRGDFAYHDNKKQVPAVWIVKSEDQPRARQMLRDAGLMDSSRNAPDSYLARSFRGTHPDPHEGGGDRRAFRIKLGLLVVIAAVIALAFMRFPGTGTPSAASSAGNAGDVPDAPAFADMPKDLLPRGRVATPDSLAVTLLRGELPSSAGSVVCLAVDGGDAPASLLAALPPTPASVLPLSRCPATQAGAAADAARGAQLIAIGKYEANDAGTGSIFMQRRRIGGRAVAQWYEVRRDPRTDAWVVIQPL